MTIRSANSLIRRAKRKNTAELIKMAVLLLLIFGAYAVVRWVDFREVLNPERGVSERLRPVGPGGVHDGHGYGGRDQPDYSRIL